MEKSMKKQKLLVIGIVLVVIIIIVCNVARHSDSKKENASAFDLTAVGIKYGKDDAPVRIVEYGDFNCSDCREMFYDCLEMFCEKIEEGQIEYIFKPVSDAIYPKIKILKQDDLSELKAVFENANTYLEDNYEVTIDEKLMEERKEEVEVIKKEMAQYNIQMIPTLYINDEKLVGLYDKETISKLLNSVVK